MAFDRKAYMKEYHKKWYSDNKDRLKQKMKDNHVKNIDRDKKRSSDWYENNRELTIERAKRNYTSDKSKKRDSNLKRSYGISLRDYDSMFERQNGRCAICGVHADSLSVSLCVDHNHKTGKVRELLCRKCNFALGYMNDDISIFKSALLYLEKHEKTK